MNKRLESLLDRVSPNFQSFRIPFHFTLFHFYVPAYWSRPSTHSCTNTSWNVNRTPTRSGKTSNGLKIFLSKLQTDMSSILVTWLCFWNATPNLFWSNHQRNGFRHSFMNVYLKMLRIFFSFTFNKLPKKITSKIFISSLQLFECRTLLPRLLPHSNYFVVNVFNHDFVCQSLKVKRN